MDQPDLLSSSMTTTGVNPWRLLFMRQEFGDLEELGETNRR